MPFRPPVTAVALGTAACLALIQGVGPAAASPLKPDRALREVSTMAAAELARRGQEAVAAGRNGDAVLAFSELAARQPRDADAQALLALAWHGTDNRNPEAGELALAGYDLALRNQPHHFWAAALAGRAALDRGKFDSAAGHFARAVLARPDDPRALTALAHAAYMAGDPAIAALAAARAAQLAPAGETAQAALRIAALAHAAAGLPEQARSWLARLSAMAPDQAAVTGERVEALLRTSALDDPAGLAESGSGLPPATEQTDQVSVDVAIVLSQNTRRERIGVNLLDGLSLNYAYNRQNTRTRNTALGLDATVNGQRVITEAIGIPQLTYNMNLFNRGGQFYSVIARPSLTAYRGETSEFFIGRSIKVAISGVNSTSLEQIDIGIEMRVTPIEITADGARLRIETSRSFLTPDAAGNFAETLTTFRQKVVATAQVRFGETLILSGLSEQVHDSSHSKTPVLGDIPVVQSLFNERARLQREDAALVLVTPTRPASLQGRAFVRGEALAQLDELWTTVVDPLSNGAAVRQRLQSVRRFSRMRSGDSRYAWPDPRADAGEAMAALLSGLPGAGATR